MTVIKTFPNADRHVTIIQNACFKRLGLACTWQPWYLSIQPCQAFFFKCMAMTSTWAWCCLLMHNNGFLSLQYACMLMCVNGRALIWEWGYNFFRSQFTAHGNCLWWEQTRVKWENGKAKGKTDTVEGVQRKTSCASYKHWIKWCCME